MSQQPAKQLIREITAAYFVKRIGPPGDMEGGLDFCSARDCDITPERHEQLGSGLRIKWRNQGGSIFVPVTNVARLTYSEREQPKETSDAKPR